MAVPVRDERADALRARYHAAFADAELPVPVEAIAEDLLGLQVGEGEDMAVSGMLLPPERQIWLNAGEVAPRRRFTLAHELGHWVCQHLEGKKSAPVYCRAADVQSEPTAADRALEREANVFAAELSVSRNWAPLLRARSLLVKRPEKLLAQAGVARHTRVRQTVYKLYSNMSVSEKTYTFRASQDLAPRLRDSLSTLSSLLEEDASGADLDEAMPAFWLAVLRHAREFEQPENQSALLRTTLEIFVEAVEKLVRDREYVRDYEQWAAEDEEGHTIRTGVLKAAARRWEE